MRRFLYACIAVLCLAVAWHIASRPANGQEQHQVIALSVVAEGHDHYLYVITSSGDVYRRECPSAAIPTEKLRRLGNLWDKEWKKY